LEDCDNFFLRGGITGVLLGKVLICCGGAGTGSEGSSIENKAELYGEYGSYG
jgi:hypothetical protein